DSDGRRFEGEAEDTGGNLGVQQMSCDLRGSWTLPAPVPTAVTNVVEDPLAAAVFGVGSPHDVAATGTANDSAHEGRGLGSLRVLATLHEVRCLPIVQRHQCRMGILPFMLAMERVTKVCAVADDRGHVALPPLFPVP